MKKKSALTTMILLLGAYLFAGVIEHTYYFNAGEVKTAKTAEGYDLVTLSNTLNSAEAGEPSLPYHSVSLLLPPGEKAVSIDLITSDKITLDGKFNIHPQQHSQPISIGASGQFVKNEKLYSTNGIYPVQKNGVLSTHYMNGHSFAFSAFTPTEYNPVTGELSVYQKITVKITTSADIKSQNALKNLRTSKEIEKTINNFDHNKGADLSQYPTHAIKGEEYDYLIITDDSYKREFDSLINFYNGRGLSTKLVSTATIYSEMSGVDNPEKIRNYIIQEYQNNGIEFVLIAGDVELVPPRGFHCTVQSSTVYSDDNIPADLYYSSLDGSWDTDLDGLWGEIGEDDLLPELSVARFSFSDTAELGILINKTVKYQSEPVLGELRDPLMVGEWAYDNPLTWGADFLNLLIGYHEDNGYATTGINEDHNITKLYDKDAEWSTQQLITQINQGHSFIHHDGHSNYNYNMRMSNNDVTNSNFSEINGVDHNYTIVYSSGCMSGGFDWDQDDCIGEKFVTIDNLAVAYVGNSRYGWFNEGQTEGPSIHLHREFIDALYGDRISQIGTAHKESKIDTAPWVNAPGQWEEGALRWCFYDCNVLGDPAMNIWTDEPENISANYQNAITIGQTDFDLDVTGTSGQPLSNLTCVIFQNDSIMGKAVTDDLGNATISIDPSIQTGVATLAISGYNTLLQEYPIDIIPNEGKYIIVDSYRITSGDDDKIEFGETAIVSVTLKNVGQTGASALEMTLSLEDDYISVIDNYENIGSVNTGDTLRIDDAFSFIVSNAIPDLHNFSLNSAIYDSEEEWNRNINLVANSAYLQIAGITVNDEDSSLDPGETAELVISYKNSGHAKALNLTGVLSSTDPKITVNSSDQELPVIGPGETLSMSYNVTASVKAVNGYVAEFSNSVSGDSELSFEDNFLYRIGSQIEDFETGDFTSFSWYFEGDLPWIIDEANSYEGTYSARSGAITHDQISALVIDETVMIDGEISFYVKTSTEPAFDPFIFYIDGVEIKKWNSGITDWAFYSYPVSAGEHTFKWSFEKDYMASEGEDCIWLDNISFPGIRNETGINEELTIIPLNTELHQNYPNPFNPSTEISYSLSSKGNVKLSVYNMKGELVATLVNREQKTGLHKAIFDAKDINSGVYFYNLSVNGNPVDVKRMLLIK